MQEYMQKMKTTVLEGKTWEKTFMTPGKEDSRVKPAGNYHSG